MEKFFKKIKSAYPKAIVQYERNYVSFTFGGGIYYQLRLQKGKIRIMATNYPNKAKLEDCLKIIKKNNIEGQEINGREIIFDLGVRNPQIFTLRLEMPYSGNQLENDKFNAGVVDSCAQFHVILLPLINNFLKEQVGDLYSLMGGISKETPSETESSHFINEGGTELNEDITIQFRESYTDEEELANYMGSCMEDFLEKGKIVVLEIKEKDLINVTKNHDLLSSNLLTMVGKVGKKSWQLLSKLIGKEESDWVKNEFIDEDPMSIALLYCNAKYVYAFSDPNNDDSVNDKTM